MIFLSLIFAFLLFCFLSPDTVSYYTASALHICINNIIPALFIVICLSKIAGRIICDYMKTTNNRKTVFPVFIMGLLFGAPSVTYIIRNLYENKLISKKYAESILGICNNTSASFILGFVSLVLSSKTGAFIVLVSNILASIIVYLLLFRRKEQLSRHIPQTAIYKTSKIEILTEAISSGTKDTIIMCGYIMFFYCVSHIISDGISLIVSAEKIKNELSFLTASMLEITSGINASSGLLGYKRILGVCFCTSLAGISVFGQIKYALSNTGLSLKTLIYSKLLCALLSPVIATVMMLFIPVEMPIITSGKIYKHPSLITHEKPKYTAIFILILCILLVIFNSLDKRHKNHT